MGKKRKGSAAWIKNTQVKLVLCSQAGKLIENTVQEVLL